MPVASLFSSSFLFHPALTPSAFKTARIQPTLLTDNSGLLSKFTCHYRQDMSYANIAQICNTFLVCKSSLHCYKGRHHSQFPVIYNWVHLCCNRKMNNCRSSCQLLQSIVIQKFCLPFPSQETS